MGKKDSPCGRKDKHVEVQDHEHGFLLVGCSDLSQACRVLDDYVDDIVKWRFFTRLVVTEDGEPAHCGVFAATHPAHTWVGGDGSILVPR
jgi:hypothetical protein